ncbi:MAG TPA: Na-translocating system protein MpsC family protein [Solirubrobacterales bacterium]|nr:Na-translocating system protein MpsC family protein [Solirubrobacterales bacterium]
MDRPDLPDSPPRGALVSQLSREIVQLHARLYGRGPTKARSYLHGDYAVCVLEEVFTTAERTLIVAGSGDHVSDTRKKFQDAVKDEFIGVVERITERKVRVFLSQVDVEANLALEFFIFAEPDGGGKKAQAGGEPAAP